MEWLDPLDAAMMTAEVSSNPLNVGAVLIMSPPPDAHPGLARQSRGDRQRCGDRGRGRCAAPLAARSRRQSLVAICPITVRSRERRSKERHNNMFGAWLCPLGTHLPDPLERLDLIHRSMSEGKHRVASRGSGASLLLLAAAIGPTVLLPMLPFAPRLRTGYNLPISHVPGRSAEMYWNGAHIDTLIPLTEQSLTELEAAMGLLP